MKVISVKMTRFGLAVALLIFLGVIFQSVSMFKSGQIYDYGVGYWGPLARDGVWHEALVAAINKQIPPQNPGLAGERLLNYHYFYDLFVSMSSRATGVDFRFFIYRFYPLVFSVLLGFLTYKFAQRLFKNRLAIVSSVFLVYFGSSFGWFLDLLKGKEIGGESTFWSNQPVSMNLNPPFAISLIILIIILLALDSYLASRKKRLALLIVVLCGILIGFKVYAAVLVLGALFLLGLKRYLLNNDLRVFIIFILSTLLAAIIYLPQANFSSPPLVFEPLWLVNSMIDLGDRVGWKRLSSARVNYQAANLWVKFLAVEVVGLAIFLIGNLGTRIVAIISFKRNFFKNDLRFFMIAASLVSLVLPFLFVQSGNPWNIVQFFYYFLYICVFWAAEGLEIIYKKLPKKISLVFIASFFIITPVSSVATFRSGFYSKPPAYLPTAEFEALTFLSKQEDGVVLKHPYDQYIKLGLSDPYPLLAYADSSYVSAYSGMRVYIEDEEQQIILGTDYKGRVKAAREFFVEKDLTKSNNFLKAAQINYLYLPIIYSLPRAEEQYRMMKIFENRQVKIYKVLQ